MTTNLTRSGGMVLFGISALRASVAVAAIMTAAVPAYAQQQTAQQVQAEKQFDIAPQALSDAINQFGLQAGVQISVNPAVLDGIRTGGVSGMMNVDAALQILLGGTGLSWTRSETGIAITRASQGSNSSSLPPIIITGEKVERNYLETLSSVGVATSQDIETYKLDEASDAYNTMANVRYFHSGGNKGMQIRGVSADGVSEPENSAQTISVIIDGVTQSSEALRRGSRGTWDMKQIEVLRGPQSTVHGPNSMAGAIVMETNDPTFYWEGAAKGVLGSQERTDGAAMISGPIGNQVAFRLAAEAREQQKDIKQVNVEDNVLNEDKYRTVRGKLLIEPEAIEELTVTLMANDVYDQPASAAVRNPFYDRTFNSGSQSTEELRKNNVNNYSVKVDYDLTDSLTLTSVTSKQDTDMTIGTAPGNGFYIRNSNRKDNNLEQDIRFVLDQDTGLNGIVGLYYADKENEGHGVTTLPTYSNTRAVSDTSTKVETSAVYANLRYKLDNGLTLIGGARLQQDKVANFIDRDVTGITNNTLSDITFAKDLDVEESYVAFLPTAGVAYSVTETQTAGLTVSRGYRQGFSQVVEFTNTEIREVDPEYVWTTELSWRDNSFRNVSWGANVFYNYYENQQITISDNNVTSSFNADGSFSYGAELEGRADFGNGLTGYGALGLLKTELGEINASSCGANCEGNDFPEAPALTASLGATYKHGSGFFVSSDANFTSSYYSNSSLNNNDNTEVSSFFLANARAGYEFKGFTLTGYVENMFDKDYITSVNSTSTRASIGDGRTFGIQIDAQF